MVPVCKPNQPIYSYLSQSRMVFKMVALICLLAPAFRPLGHMIAVIGQGFLKSSSMRSQIILTTAKQRVKPADRHPFVLWTALPNSLLDSHSVSPSTCTCACRKLHSTSKQIFTLMKKESLGEGSLPATSLLIIDVYSNEKNSFCKCLLIFCN